MSAAVSPQLLTREAAARFLGVTSKSFTRHVQPQINTIYVGRRPMFAAKDIEQWVEDRRDGVSIQSAAGSTSHSRLRASSTVSPSVRAIMARLESSPRKSTPRLFPVDGGRSGSGGPPSST